MGVISSVGVKVNNYISTSVKRPFIYPSARNRRGGGVEGGGEEVRKGVKGGKEGKKGR